MTEHQYLEHIENSILEIQNIDYTKSWAYEKVIDSILKIRKLPIILYEYQADNIIFRSRVNDNNDFFRSKREINVPKEKYVENYARANKPRQSLFYGSENRPTSYLEFAEHLADTASFGDDIMFTIGTWRLNRDICLFLIFNPNASREIKYNKFHGEAFDQFIESIDKELRKGTIKFFEFIGNEFSKPSNGDIKTYLITAAYSNIVYGYEACDGIIYPSVPRCGEGYNIAIKKENLTDGLLTLESARIDKFKVARQRNGKHSFKNTASMEASKILYDTIEWNNGWQHCC